MSGDPLRPDVHTKGHETSYRSSVRLTGVWIAFLRLTSQGTTMLARHICQFPFQICPALNASQEYHVRFLTTYIHRLGGIVGGVSFLHVLLPGTVDDVFSLVPHHTIFSPVATLPLPFLWNLLTAHLYEASLLRAVFLVPAILFMAQRLERLWSSTQMFLPDASPPSMEDQLRELFRGTSQSGCLPSRDLLQILEKLPSGEPSSFWQSFVLDTSHVDLDELVRDVCEVVDGPKSTELKVWLSFVKLDDKLPTVSSVQRLLYESPEGSAEGADVIALFFTDLFIHRSSIMDLRSLLRRAMGDRAEPYASGRIDFLVNPANCYWLAPQ
eukprot:symbB.v1.2.040520.t1/scaffold7301.1/size12057/1